MPDAQVGIEPVRQLKLADAVAAQVGNYLIASLSGLGLDDAADFVDFYAGLQ